MNKMPETRREQCPACGAFTELRLTPHGTYEGICKEDHVTHIQVQVEDNEYEAKKFLSHNSKSAKGLR